MSIYTSQPDMVTYASSRKLVELTGKSMYWKELLFKRLRETQAEGEKQVVLSSIQNQSIIQYGKR
jgi:hypothetical protein